MKLLIPHSLLARDNERIGGMVRGKLLLSKRYRERKDAMHLFAMAQVKKQDMLTGRLRLRGTAFWPDRTKRDLMFFVKALHDALEGVAYEDDCQLVDIHYVFGGIDKERPRIELDIEALPDE
jgi:Holliday junction resolvase RusA-like endonuclease